MTERIIPGPAGSLQLWVESPSAESKAIAVICHPHPLHGGTLNNKVVHQLARTFRKLGAVSFRFNFRGVGKSSGEYDEGRGELDDLLAVVVWAKNQWPDRDLWLAGFSFGAFVALKAAQQLVPDWLVTVAPAVNHFPDNIPLDADFPWLLIHGDQDEIVPADTLLSWFHGLEHPPRLELLEGAGHFFHGRLNDLSQTIEVAARESGPGALRQNAEQ
ncbi:MAG: alpha/beta fold hydrolase [Thiogranum sp.]|nr:alpha/beta fold hydrolase [Thiogranum sp.]